MNNNKVTDLSENCIECGLCVDNCQLLIEAGESPAAIAKRGATLSEALSCSLCGACAAACPADLNPMELFAAKRREAVASGEFETDEFRYLYPDRKNNVMSIYRRENGIEYSEIDSSAEVDSCFFPGCTLMTYSPGLTQAVYRRLKDDGICQAIWTDCCGKLLEQLGVQPRLENMREHLRTFVKQHKIKRLIAACPGCYYELKKLFQGSGLIIQTVYEVLDFTTENQNENRRCSVHDSCPDRFSGLFGGQVRKALEQNGFTAVEMAHAGENTVCCGSGGQLSHFRPDMVEGLVQLRQEEFQQTGADMLVGYCLSCVLKYDGMLSGVPVAHALNLLLELEPDYLNAKERAARMFEGPEGEKLWAEIMTD